MKRKLFVCGASLVLAITIGLLIKNTIKGDKSESE